MTVRGVSFYGRLMDYMQKLYCYVDESGQDTEGRMFIVSIVIVEENRELLLEKLEAIEAQSRKGQRKWFHTNKERRERYIRLLLESKFLKDCISYSCFKDTKAYIDLTILTTAKAILNRAHGPYQATVWVDGLGTTERHRFAAGLRKLKVVTRKVSGVREQSDAFIRLADAIAGFVRDAIEGDPTMKELYQYALKQRLVRVL